MNRIFSFMRRDFEIVVIPMPERKKANADDCCQQIGWEDLDLAPIRALISLAKSEDLQGSGLAAKPRYTGDHTSNLLPEAQAIACQFTARQSMVICGIALAREVIAHYDPALTLDATCNDGDRLAKGQAIAQLAGPARSLLAAERPLLNFLQRLSGVATSTAEYVAALGDSKTRLLDTRKTTPGYRYLEKYAVTCGGGWNHRMGLFDRIMLKDNHIATFGENPIQATRAAVQASRQRAPELLVEMEVDSLEQIPIALAAEVDIILLDNFSIASLKTARQQIDGQAITEISGGVTIDSLPQLGPLGHDFISTGATVHQSRWLDIGLDWL